MSNLNIGLQCVELMRQQMPDQQEALATHCNNISQLRSTAKKYPDLVLAVLDSIEPVKVLLSGIFQRLELHGKKFFMFPAASEENLQELWSELEAVDSSLEFGKVYRQSVLNDLPALSTFLDIVAVLDAMPSVSRNAESLHVICVDQYATWMS